MPYVYAVTEAGTPAEGAVRWGALAAIVGEPPAAAEPDEDSLWQHEAVVEAAMEEGPVLPMRFGSVVDDVAAFLAQRHDELAVALERVRGAVELGVRLEEAPCASEPESGTEYLLRRAASAALADRVHIPLAALARASVRRAHSFAYLVDREACTVFRARVAVLAEELDTGIVVTGPWPPYSFVA